MRGMVHVYVAGDRSILLEIFDCGKEKIDEKY